MNHDSLEYKPNCNYQKPTFILVDDLMLCCKNPHSPLALAILDTLASSKEMVFKLKFLETLECLKNLSGVLQ